jgi:glycosyltransferase involved in cell wall biosynthesis
LDLIIPARNEQDNIPTLLRSIPRGDLRHVVLVNNGSTDQTAQLARTGGLVVIDEPRRGYGAACLAGLSWLASQPSPPDAVAFLDADLSDDPAGLITLCKPIVSDRADLVVASRIKLAEPGSLTGPQRICSTVASAFIHWTTGCTCTDLGPMRAIRWSTLQRLRMQDTTWGWTVEMQYKAAAYGFRVREIDVTYRRRHAGASKISRSLVGSARAGCKISTTLARLWWESLATRRGVRRPEAAHRHVSK